MRFLCAIIIALLAAASLAAQSPALSECERAKVDIIALQDQLRELRKHNADLMAEIGRLHQAIGPLQDEKTRQAIQRSLAELKAEIERAHPGYAWEPATGLVRKQ